MRHWRRDCIGLLACAVGLVSATSVYAQGWKVDSFESLPSPAEGISHRVQTLARPPSDSRETEATLHFVTFDAGQFTFRVIDQGNSGHDSLGEAMIENHCLAGSNGGYFQSDFEPVGLLVGDGRVIHPVRTAKLLSGALVVTTNHITLRRSTEPLPGLHARQAIQAGPFLVENGKLVPGLNAVRAARRTAVVTDGARRWGIVSASSVTLEDFGNILADPSLTPPGFKIARALNLDGGGSTALWMRAPGGGNTAASKERPNAKDKSAAPAEPEAFYIHEFGSVRDFLGIVPREAVKGKTEKAEGKSKK